MLLVVYIKIIIAKRRKKEKKIISHNKITPEAKCPNTSIDSVYHNTPNRWVPKNRYGDETL